jgi:hypothetical protein
MGRHHQAVFKNPGTGKASPLFMEWQKWLKARPTDLEDPIGPGYNPVPFSMAESAPQEPSETARDEIARARSLGMNVSVYTIPLLIDRDDWPSFDADWLLHDRMGHPIPDLGLGAFLTDLGNEAVPDWFANTMYRDIMDGTPDLGGIYMDTLGGSGSFLRYPAPGSPFFNFKYHGGTKYIEGGRRLLDMVRHQVGKNKQPHRHPDIPFVATEGVQEFYTGKYDAAQHGLKPLPLQTQLSVFIDQLTSPGLPPAPVEAQTGNPPLWNLVYHEYSRAEALGMMLSTRGVSALLGGWEEWGNYNRLVHALMFIQGMKPTLFSYFYDFRDLSLLVENNGTVEVRDPSVPQQVQMLEFMQRMHESISRSWEAGQYLNHGAMERPLALPTLKLTATGFEPGEVTTTRNPAIPTFERNDQLLGVTKHFYEDPFTQALIYPVANVLHSVWRASPLSSRLGLVFVNWSDQPAAWRGTFDPRLYDFFQSRFRVTGVAPAGGGVSTYPVGLGDGTTLLSWNTAGDGLKLQHHSQSSPGLMPPRSVQVFWIDPLW